MSAPTIADFFKGCSTQEYSQYLGSETYPSSIVDGVPQGYYTLSYKGVYTEQTFEFEGVPGSLLANGLPSSSITVTDTNNRQYTVSFANSLTTHGNTNFETMSNKVMTTKISPHLWRIVVVHREGTVAQI